MTGRWWTFIREAVQKLWKLCSSLTNHNQDCITPSVHMYLHIDPYLYMHISVCTGPQYLFWSRVSSCDSEPSLPAPYGIEMFKSPYQCLPLTMVSAKWVSAICSVRPHETVFPGSPQRLFFVHVICRGNCYNRDWTVRMPNFGSTNILYIDAMLFPWRTSRIEASSIVKKFFTRYNYTICREWPAVLVLQGVQTGIDSAVADGT